MMKNKYLLVTVFLALLVVAGAFLIFKIPSAPANQLSQNTSTSDTIDSASTNTLGAETSPVPVASATASTDMNDQLQIQDEIVGTGSEAVTGKTVTVNYVGTFTNGTKFDSSYDRNQPFPFTLGAGQVISGWDQGVVGMKVGGKRKLIIPPSLGYGPNDYNGIPGNSTLVFEIELLKVE